MVADASHLYLGSTLGLVALPTALATVYPGQVGALAVDDDAVVFSANDPARDDLGTIYRLAKR